RNANPGPAAGIRGDGALRCCGRRSRLGARGGDPLSPQRPESKGGPNRGVEPDSPVRSARGARSGGPRSPVLAMRSGLGSGRRLDRRPATSALFRRVARSTSRLLRRWRFPGSPRSPSSEFSTEEASMPSCRDVYLKIERIPGYSPLASDDAERNLFRRDCMFNHGHEDGKIPDAEVALSRLDAIVYRDYLDA